MSQREQFRQERQMKEKPPGLEDRERVNAKADEAVVQTDMERESETGRGERPNKKRE